MTWPANRELVDSGVEWIGCAPASWQVLRFAHLVDRANAGEVIDKNSWGSGEELLFTCAREPVVSDFSPFPPAKRTKDRDILITRNATPYIHLPPPGSIYSNVVQRVSLLGDVDRYWARYALEAASASMHGYGVSIDTFNFGMWKSLRLPLPPSDEQRAIVDFLDRETAKVDALIDKQEQLIATLREDRTATITHAVTKGLDSDVEMKDSGVEWMGNVPVSWKVLRFAHVFDKANAGEVIDKNWWGGGGELLFTCAREPVASDFSPFPEWKRTTERDILITRNATPYIHLPPAGSIYSNVVQRVSLPDRVDRNWASYALEAASASMHGYGVSIDTFNFGMWRSLRLPVPPISEQRKITEYIERKCAKIDGLISKAEEMIDTLAEYRSALITDAVTGKIDVRGAM